MTDRERIHQFTEQSNFLQLRDRVQFQLSEIIQVLLNDVITKSVKRINVHPPGIRPDKRKQPPPHGHRPRVRIGKAKNIMRIGIRIGQELSDRKSTRLNSSKKYARRM